MDLKVTRNTIEVLSLTAIGCNNFASLQCLKRCALKTAQGKRSLKMLFNHKFTSKLESRGQSATLDKHLPSIFSQLSVSVDAGGAQRDGGSQSP